MFESIISDLLNRVLGTYIDNFDKNRLSISLWNGDVVLQDLDVKQSALDELDLPLRPVFGHIRHLTLKIPWKNLYTSQWVAQVEGLYLIIVPNTSITYNAEKEETFLKESKMAAVQRVEEAKQKVKDKEKGDSAKQEDGFYEKLFAQVIRNIQITIKDIHIRYEDGLAAHQPFAVGITLNELSVRSTDSEWNPCLDTAKYIYKFCNLDSFAVYWNPNANLICNNMGSKESTINYLKSLVASEETISQDMKYVLGPIRSTAKLTLNPKPEADEEKFSHPKLLLDFVMDELSIGLSRHQYANIMALLDALDRRRLSDIYRKFRPLCKDVIGHAREWWLYAFHCIRDDIQRINQNWSWVHIRKHRTIYRSYKAAYKLKLENKTLSKQEKDDLEEGETFLDQFNIILIRRQAEMEVEKEGEVRKQNKKNTSWLGGWFSWGAGKQDAQEVSGGIVKQFEATLTDDEKNKLYDAIGYQECGLVQEYPEYFVDLVLKFLLKDLKVIITDEEAGDSIVTKASLSHVATTVEKRSGADALRVTSSMLSFVVEGFCTDGNKPQLVSSEGTPLLDIIFETNPEDKRCDQRLKIKSQPLEIIYDAATINQLAKVFDPPQDVSLQQLQAAALNKMEIVKERSTTGLQSVIDNTSILDVDISLAASHIVIPEKGFYVKGCSALVFNLGSMKMTSVPRNTVNLVQLRASGLTQDEINETIRNASYDCFTIKLFDIQGLVAFKEEDWRPYLTCCEDSPLHLLQPTTLHIDLLKCYVKDDPSLAKIKINVSLPNVCLSVIDERLLQLAYIANSIPAPESEQQKSAFQDSKEKDLNMNIISEEQDIVRLETMSLNMTGDQHDVPQFTNLALMFTLDEISLEVKKAVEGNHYQPLVKLAALSATVELTHRTFDLQVTIILGGVMVQHLENGAHWLLSTPLVEGSSQALLTVNFIQVNPKSPEFYTKYNSTAQLMCIDVSNLKAHLEQAAILSILAFVDQLSQKLGAVTSSTSVPPPVVEPVVVEVEPSASLFSRSISSYTDRISTAGTETTDKSRKSSAFQKKKLNDTNIVTLKVIARLGKVAVVISHINQEIAQIDVAGLVVNAVLKDDDVILTSKLKDFTIIDPTPIALHSKIERQDPIPWKIVEVVDAEAWDAEVSIYGKATAGTNYLDMKRVDTQIKLTFGCARIVFLNKFVTDVLNWIDKFQIAKAAIASASVAAAAAAQAGLQDVYDQCSRISLSLTLRAPLILIPQDSQSLSGLMIDLGLITVNNHFEMGKERNELGYPAIYDIMNLELQNVKVSRVELTSTGSLDHEYELLEPITLIIDVCRNLTISWNKQKPEIEIKADLKPIKLSISEEDLLVTLTVLQDNLGEEATSSLSDSSGAQKQPESMETTQDVELALAEHGHIFTKMKLSIIIEAVTCCLLTGGRSLPRDTSSDISSLSRPSFSSTLESLPLQTASSSFHSGESTSVLESNIVGLSRVKLGDSASEEGGLSRTSDATAIDLPPLKNFAEFSLHCVTISGEFMSNGNLAVNSVLYDCILQDTRQGRETYITRMMERKIRDGKQGMIDVTFRSSPNDAFVDVRVSEFVLVLHLPYLLRIGQFFTDNMPPPPKKKPMPAKVKEFKRQKSSNEPAVNDLHQTSMLTIRLKIEQPDIALVEDVSSLDTPCIILHTEVNADLRMTPTDKNIKANITGMQMYTCCYHPDKRQQTLSQILGKCELSLQCSSTTEHAEHIDIILTPIELRVNPGTIELLSNIATGIGVDKQEIECENEIKTWTELWDPKPLNTPEFPFLVVEEGLEAMIIEESTSIAPTSVGGEYAVVGFECILITLEAGSGTSPIPLIKLQASGDVKVKGFQSRLLELTGSSSIEFVYYNPRLAIWEPLVEPVESIEHFGSPHHKPWTIDYEVINESLTASGTTPSATSPVSSPTSAPDIDETDYEELAVQQPICTISVTAQDPLQLTVSKTCLEVLTSLSGAFSDAYKRKLTARQSPKAPYHIVNRTGININVVLKESGFQVAGHGKEGVEEVTVESGAEVDLFDIKPLPPKHKRATSLVANFEAMHDRRIKVKIPSLQTSCLIPVTRADKRFFPIENKSSGEKWGLVTAISIDSGCKYITLSSCVQVKNNLDVSVDVYYMTERGNEVEFVLTMIPGEESLLPLYAVYTPSAELFFSVKEHSVCIIPFVWRGLQNNPGYVQELQCIPRDVREVHSVPFYICATGDVEQILFENTSRRTMSSALFKIQLWPCLVLHNLLPVPISLEPPGTLSTSILMPGCSLQLTKARLGSMYLELQLLDYQCRDWVCGKPIEANPSELSVWTFESRGDQINGPLSLDLGMHVARTKSTLSMSIYCPFWMVNKTGLMLTYRGDALNNIVVHEEDNKEPVLFSFKSKSFFGKKKASIKVNDSDWSERFSLDVAGNSGSVTCKGPGKSYQVGVSVKFGNSGLTKMVIFSPYYKVLNKAKYNIEVMEVGPPQAEWFTVLAGECIGWWPTGTGRLLKVRVRGTDEVTEALSYDKPIAVLLKLSNMYGGIMSEVSLSDGGILVTLGQCYEGASTVHIINHLSNTTVTLWQKNMETKALELPPQTIQYYTWGAPAGDLEMEWSCGSKESVCNSLEKDDQGTMNGSAVHWVVFLHGNQRCLLFTDNIDIASSALNAVELERIHLEVKISLSSIGLSLVDDIKRKEVAYVSLSSSGIVWENCKMKGKKHRPFTQEQTEHLEKCYQLYQKQIQAIGDASLVQGHFVIHRNLEVDYVTMTVSKPFNRRIRRTFHPGVWAEFRSSPHQRHIHLKLNSLQIDNQIDGVMFNVVFARVPPPRSVMAETVPKPFCEVSIVQRLTSPSFMQYKYFAVLIQEFHLKCELPFVFAIQEVFSSTTEDTLYSVKKYEQDIMIVYESLQETVKHLVSEDQKDCYDHLHLSPIKMHLSFSLSGSDSGSSVPVAGRVIHLFLQSVGVTMTEVQDLVFRLAYFERMHMWMNSSQFVQELTSHYVGQVIKQLYVVLLGLDLLGNPYGLVTGVKKGVEDLFYEPIQGAIEGPGEFAEGVMYGVTNFLGKTVGGATGAAARITGTLGKGFAALTFDDNFQKNRQAQMARKPADGIESVARGTKGVLTGVVEGVTGVVTKPVDGAREAGVEGFFKGVGKGMVGLVARPVIGVVDFASTSLDAVTRATNIGEEVNPVRPARFINADGVIRPFVQRFAEGAKLLRELEKGRYSETDIYVAHAYVTGSKSILLATDKRIMLITKIDILGSMKVDWVHIYEELSEGPSLTPKGLRLSVKQEKKRVLHMFGGGDNSKVIHINDPEQAKWFLEEIVKTYIKGYHSSR